MCRVCGEGQLLGGGAAAFDQDDVAPYTVVPADALASTDDPEPRPLMQSETAGVLGEDAGLDRPGTRRLGRSDQGPLGDSAHPSAAGFGTLGWTYTECR